MREGEEREKRARREREESGFLYPSPSICVSRMHVWMYVHVYVCCNGFGV